MKKHWKILLTAVVVITIALAGCCMIKPIPIPEECQDSVIYQKLKNPAAIGTMIQLANLEAIRSNTYKKKEAITAVATIKTLLEKEPITFSDFLEGVKPIGNKYFKDYGVELLIISTTLSGLYIDIPISSCDKNLIIKLCDKMLKQLSIKEGPLIIKE